MENWKNAREASGCPIKAAYACPDFDQFLDHTGTDMRWRLLLAQTVLKNIQVII